MNGDEVIDEVIKVTSSHTLEVSREDHQSVGCLSGT